MVDYLQYVKPLEDAGKTDIEIAQLLSTQTQTDMPNSVLRKYLHKNNLWLIDPSTGLRSAGTIGEAYSGLTDPQKELVRKLQAWVYDQESIETENDLDVALEFRTIIDGMVSVSILTSAERIAIFNIAGGLRHGALVEVDITQSRTDWEAEEAARQAAEAAAEAARVARQQHDQWQGDYQGRWNTHVAPVLDDVPNRDNTALIAGLRALADDLEANPWSP